MQVSKSMSHAESQCSPFAFTGPRPDPKFGPKACLYCRRSSQPITEIPDASTHILKWESPPKNVLVIKKIGDPSLNEQFVQVVSYLIKKYDMEVFVEHTVMDDLTVQKLIDGYRSKIQTYHMDKCNLNNRVDFVICLGGDGTLLYASSIFQESIPPVMAFHLGSLGFLAPFCFSEYQKRIDDVIKGQCSMVLRSRLKSVFEFNKNSKPTETVQVLNEVVIDRGISAYLSAIELYIENELITIVQGDGIIIATPTGSTAYACAAGSSMVHPGLPAMIITPICPHSLSFRPIVIPAGCEVMIKLTPVARSSAWVAFDGRNKHEINVGDVLRITTSIYPMPSVCFHNQISDWFMALKKSLHWNERVVQKELKRTNSLDKKEKEIEDLKDASISKN